ncbi:NAD(P)-dependent oxidoreductase [Alicyclobacillus cycloheptanicus]|uniref:3-hydroxyisobutyrate dehydrogenase n=1 Tax=Alicyclobacillus cycloheptanicus TaxID=1457 RepID=A0ABT9XKH6_9BACL|nr:NAD(P)-dependent oxidoreductase [Alicyclobacillus cycloheptanicus]MDQ0190246.1 3-hydroxyisobutyrate dehydrogenase [Alicyclobacillus cycloheptanicus]
MLTEHAVLSPERTTIGFVGTGVMGRSMAANLMKAGYRLVVSTRTREKAQPLLDAGAVWKDTAGEVAAAADVIITIVGLPSDVEEVYLHEGGIIHRAKPGAYLIDMTTSAPALARRIYEQAKARGLHALDAPVSGGDVGAKNGTLVIMVGGEEPDFQAVQPIFEALGKNIVLHGPAGMGQHAKMCNQIAIATNMIGVAEAMAYAVKAGLDPERVLSSITGGAAGSWSLSNLAPRMIRGDFAPGFYIQHLVKDLRIALDMADQLGLALPGVKLSESMYEALIERGEAYSGTQALYKYYVPDAQGGAHD